MYDQTAKTQNIARALPKEATYRERLLEANNLLRGVLNQICDFNDRVNGAPSPLAVSIGGDTGPRGIHEEIDTLFIQINGLADQVQKLQRIA